MPENPWKRLSSTYVHENPWFAVREDAVIRPDGAPGTYGVVEARRLAIAVVPLWPDNTVTLVGQYRYPIDEYTWEVPEGGGPLAGDALETAQQELAEEAGLAATSWTPLGHCHLSNCFLREEARMFLARGLTADPTARPCGDEKIATVRMGFADVLGLIDTGRITDALTIVALFKVERFLTRGRQTELLHRPAGGVPAAARPVRHRRMRPQRTTTWPPDWRKSFSVSAWMK